VIFPCKKCQRKKNQQPGKRDNEWKFFHSLTIITKKPTNRQNSLTLFIPTVKHYLPALPHFVSTINYFLILLVENELDGYTIILIVFWVGGLLLHIAGGLIHLFLVAAVIIFAFRFFRRNTV
jgi:type IV secretory pathway TrbL component